MIHPPDKSGGLLAPLDKEDLETLAKLGELRKAGIITESEFQSKKKKILGRI